MFPMKICAANLCSVWSITAYINEEYPFVVAKKKRDKTHLEEVSFLISFCSRFICIDKRSSWILSTDFGTGYLENL